MTTLHLVDEEQRTIVGSFAPFDRHKHGLVGLRSLMVDGLGALLTPEPVDFDTTMVPGPAGAADIRVVIHRQEISQTPAPAILYIHGGGMVAGTPEMMAGAHRRLSDDTGAFVFAPAYRLGPEHPYPAGVEDIYAALFWLHANSHDLGIDPDRIAIMGDSGGGGIAAATALLSRDRGQIPLKAQILLYPMLDIRTGTADAPTDDPLTGEFVVNRDMIGFVWGLVRGDAILDETDMGYLSPALAKDLRALPRTIILTGALDLFRDEDIAYAQRLMSSGVATDLFVHAGAVHGFDMLGGGLAEQARVNFIGSIRRVLSA